MATDPEQIQIKVNDNELVVDLNDLAGVQKILDSMGVSWERIEKCARLRLALVRLGDLSNVPEEHTDPRAWSDLDRLISYLKRSFEAGIGRTPIIGKNRLTGSVEGSPYTGGGWGGPYVGGTEPGPYTGAGGPGPYIGGGGPGPYIGGGGPGPYIGGDRGDPQWNDSRGSFPERKHPPADPVKVGILDTRLFAHPDLAGRYLADHDALVPATIARTPDSEAHATFIAGVVLTRAPNADLIVGHVLNAYNTSGSSWDVATRMADFADASVAVLNISFGVITYDNEPPLVLSRAVEVLSRTVTIVGAAGNHGPDERPIWPAALKHVVAVGAGTRVNGTDEFNASKFSPDQKWVDLLAPGENIRSLYKTDGYATWNGTSFSAAAVSGAIAYLVGAGDISCEEAVEVLRTPPTARKLAAASEVIGDIGPKR
jgi:hypothetical protein